MSGMSFDEMMKKAATADGFLAALDQSGGSTPKALKMYGVPDDAYTAGEKSMYDRVHEMRVRIMTSPSFTGDKILGAILFENTMDRMVNGMPTCQYLWQEKRIVPFLKIDKGLQAEENGVQLMKQIPDLSALLQRAKSTHGVFGTKMRSVILNANAEGIRAIVDQQFEIGKQILAAGLVPILEPEVDIHSPDKEVIEDMLKQELLAGLDKLQGPENRVMLKLTIPTRINHYAECIAHPQCVRVVALSGGYTRDEANALLRQHKGMIASFSRALVEGLTYQQSQEDFDRDLAAAIESIWQASKAG